MLSRTRRNLGRARERERKKEGPAYKARTRKNNARAVRFVGMPPRESARRCVAGRGMVGSLLEERRIALRCVWVNVCMLCRGTGVWGVFERLYIYIYVWFYCGFCGVNSFLVIKKCDNLRRFFSETFIVLVA